MALVEFSVTVQTGDYVDDPITKNDAAKLDDMLKGMQAIAERSEYIFELADWEELKDE